MSQNNKYEYDTPPSVTEVTPRIKVAARVRPTPEPNGVQVEFETITLVRVLNAHQLRQLLTGEQIAKVFDRFGTVHVDSGVLFSICTPMQLLKLRS